MKNAEEPCPECGRTDYNPTCNTCGIATVTTPRTELRSTGWVAELEAARDKLEELRVWPNTYKANQEWHNLFHAKTLLNDVIASVRSRSSTGADERPAPAK